VKNSVQGTTFVDWTVKYINAGDGFNSDSVFSIDGGEVSLCQGSGVYVQADYQTPVTIKGISIHHNQVGIKSYAPLILTNTALDHNEKGLDFGNPTSTFESSVVSCNLFANGFDVYMTPYYFIPRNLAATGNYWGDPADPVSSTYEMNQGGNPKNISWIHDSFDDAALGTVDYSGFVQTPFTIAP
jgi:hypothetical protein